MKEEKQRVFAPRTAMDEELPTEDVLDPPLITPSLHSVTQHPAKSHISIHRAI